MKTMTLFATVTLVLWQASSGMVGWTTVGNTVYTDDYVGIKRMNPDVEFDVNGHIATSSLDPYLRTNANDKDMVVSGGGGWVDSAATLVLRGAYASYNAHGVEIYTGGNQTFILQSNGKIGIGAAEPTAKLDVISTSEESDRATAGGRQAIAVSGVADGISGIGVYSSPPWRSPIMSPGFDGHPGFQVQAISASSGRFGGYFESAEGIGVYGAEMTQGCAEFPIRGRASTASPLLVLLTISASAGYFEASGGRATAVYGRALKTEAYANNGGDFRAYGNLGRGVHA